MNSASGPEPTGAGEHPRSAAEIVAELRLRPDPPRVMRLSRRAVSVLATGAGLGLGAILIVALRDQGPSDAPTELVSTERVQEAEGLAGLPRGYGDVPRLGPPLPGELGRPFLRARERGEAVPAPTAYPAAIPPVDADEQLRLQELEAARLSVLFAEASTAVATGGGGAATNAVTSAPSAFPQPITASNERDPDEQRQASLEREVDRRTISPERLTPPASPFLLQAGTVISAALVTGIRSDLPGQIAAQVTSHVYDSPSGRYLLIPQGARLLGEYDSRVDQGQRRLLLVWTRLILPDGRSIVLGRLPATDAAGYTGVEDQIDRHWRQVFLAAGLATVLNIGLASDAQDKTDVARAIREGFGDTLGRTGDEVIRRELSVPPTLTIRPGFPVRVIVTRDLVLEPLGELR